MRIIEFLESDYHIVAKEIGKGNKITIPKKFGLVGKTVFIIMKRED